MKRARYEKLYCEHYPRVLGLCRRILGPQGDAEDAAQDVFERGYKQFGKYRTEEPFEPWISTIARNLCIDRLRRRARFAAVFADAGAEPPEAEDPMANGVGGLISAHTATAVCAAVDALPDRYRLPLVLAYYADASYDEIASSLDLQRNHVGVLLLRGKARLREALAEFAEDSL